MKKKFKYDGKSRPSNDLYKKNYKIIFGKKVKKNEEVTGYYYNGYDKNAEIEVLTEKVKDPFKTQQDELDESYKQSKKNKKEREKELKKLCDRNGF